MNLEALRLSAGYSRQYVAKNVGVSRQTVWYWERGARMPTADKAVKLAALFHITVEKLMEE